jgi:hemerythrin-like metal-binding protein
MPSKAPTLSRFIHYKTGVESIDSQHLALVNIIDSIKTAISNKDTYEVEQLTLHFCHSLGAHLKSEEDLMNSFNYKYVKAHTSSHDALRHKLAGIKANISNYSKFFNPSDMEQALLDDIDHSDIQMGEAYLKYCEDKDSEVV